MQHIEQMGDRIANRIFALSQDVEILSAQINDLRDTMFRAAQQLRELPNPDQFQHVISELELPGRTCAGQGCAHARQLESQIEQLNAQVFAYETIMMNVTQQLGVSPTGEDYPDAGCCPRVTPNLDEDQST